jgi:hypothetical protein
VNAISFRSLESVKFAASPMPPETVDRDAAARWLGCGRHRDQHAQAGADNGGVDAHGADDYRSAEP